MNAVCDLETSGAVAVYMLFGTTPPPDRLRYAPYGLTIGTASGTGKYWKRVLRPALGTPAFDAADTRHGNEVRLRFEKLPQTGQQHLVAVGRIAIRTLCWCRYPSPSLASANIATVSGEKVPFW